MTACCVWVQHVSLWESTSVQAPATCPAPHSLPRSSPPYLTAPPVAPPHTHTTTATTSPQDPERQVVAIGAPHGTLRRRAGDQHPNHVAALPLQVRARARGRGPAAEAGTACVQWGSGQWRRWCSAGAAFPCHPLHLHPHPPQPSRRPPPPPAHARRFNQRPQQRVVLIEQYGASTFMLPPGERVGGPLKRRVGGQRWGEDAYWED